MHDDTPVYDHPVLSVHARRALVVVAAVAALVLGLISPAHAAVGHVVGVVTAEGGGPLQGVVVEVFSFDFQVEEADVTDASGHYDVALPPGSYAVFFFPDEDYEPELYDDVHDFDLDHADPVVVASGGSTTADAALTRLASISGHVTENQADAGSSIQVYDDQNHVVRRGSVHSDGSYKVSGLAAGSYRLAFNRLSGFAFSAPEFYDDHAEEEGVTAGDQVTLTPGEARTGIDAVLTEGGHITGTLHDSDGHPMRCRLQAFTTGSSLVTRNGWSDSSTGAFDIAGLSTGSYLVRVINSADCQNSAQYLDGTGGALSADASAADPVAATRGAHTALALTLVYDLGPNPVSTMAPSITGTPAPGAQLTAHHGSWSPASHLTFHYQWLSSGTPISGATRSTYRPTPSDIGKALSVRVTALRGARSGVATSVATAPVSGPAGSLVNLAPPTVNGGGCHPTPSAPSCAVVDMVLTASPGQWSAADTSFRYVWRAGRYEVQSTSPSMRVPADFFGEQLTLTVQASRPGSSVGPPQVDGSVTILVATRVGKGIWPDIKPPKLKGTARVGHTLRIKAATVNPRPDRVKYAWYRDGSLIPDVHGLNYTVLPRDVGKSIKVRVLYIRQHYPRLSIRSKSRPVASG